MINRKEREDKKECFKKLEHSFFIKIYHKSIDS